ncbi:MAG: zinc ribbon-containing protein [Usitatibacter sp.]
MRQPSTPTGNNGNSQRTRTRGAIRTHLGRKRTGPRSRMLRGSTLDQISEVTGAERHRQEDLFDRMFSRFQEIFTQAGETTLAAFDKALDTAFDGLVSAGEFTAENGERLRHYVRRDLLHRENPALTFRTGDITSAGTLSCAGCGWTIITSRTAVLPPCPQCSETAFRKMP